MIKHYLKKSRLLGIALLWLWVFLISGKDIQAIGQYSFSSSVSASGIGTPKQISVVRSGKAFVLGIDVTKIGNFSSNYNTFTTPTININGTPGDLIATSNALYILSTGTSGQVHRYTYDASNTITSANTLTIGSYGGGIALDYSGNIWYTKSTTIYKYTGNLSTQLTSYTASQTPAKLTVDGSGNFYYVRSTSGSSIYKNTNATAFNASTTTGTPRGIFASYGGYIYYGTSSGIYKFNPSGTLLWSIGLSNIAGMSVSSSGNITLINTSGTVTVYSPINAITAASATPTGSAIKLSWTSGVPDSDYQGAMIRRSPVAYPTSTTDGVLVSRNITASSVSYIDAGVTANTTYYYTVFNQTLDGYSSQGVTMSATSGSSGSTVPSIPTFNQVYKTALSSNIVYLSWTVPSTTDHLVLKRVSTSGTTTINASIAASATSITDTVGSDGSYSYKLYAVNASGGISSASTSSTLTIDTTPPSVPTFSSAVKSASNGKQISLAWTAPSSTDHFVLKRISSVSGTSTLTANVSASITSYTDSGLDDASYYYQLYAIDAYSNTSNASTSSPLTIDTTPPSQPTLTAIKTALNGTVMDLAWNAPLGTSTFILKQSFNGGSSVTLDANIDASTTSSSITATQNGTYNFSIYAVDAYDNISNIGISSTLNIDTTPPSIPTFSSAVKSASNGTQISLAWAAPSSTDHFVLKRISSVSGTSTLTANVSASITSYTDSGLDDASYYYQLYAIDAYSNTSNASTSSPLTIDTTPPSQPTLTAIKTALNGTVMNLAWNAPLGTSTFILKQSFNGGSSVTLDANIDASTTSSSITATQNGTYNFSIYAVDAYANISNVGISSTLNIDTTPPSIPTFSSAVKSASNGKQISLAWTTPSSTDHFVLKRISSVSGTSTLNANLPAATTSYADSGLADASYSYQLYAVDAYANTSNVSTTATLNIDTTAPSKPLLTGLRIRPNTASLSWSVPSTAATITLQVSQDNGGIRTITTNVPTSVTTWVQTGLADGTYRYYLYALDSYANSSPVATADVVIDTVAPAAPTVTILKHANNSPTVNISWTVPSETSAFNYRLSKNGNIVGGVDRLSASQSEYPDLHLSDGTYTFSIQGLDLDNNASVTGSADVIIDTTAPATPTFNSAMKSAPNGSSIALTWTTPSSTDHFVLKRISSVSGTTTLNANLPASTTAYSDSGLADANYSYKLYAVDAYANTSNASTSTTLTIDTTAPTKPLLAGLRVRPNTASLSWSVPSTAATIKLQVSQNNGAINTITENASASLTTWSQAGLTDGHYRYYLYAIDSYANISQVATADIVVDATAPVAPTVTILKSASNSPTVNISWTVPSSTSAFNYRLSKNGSLVGGVDRLSASQSEYPTMHLSDGTYTFSIQALDLDGNASVTGSADVVIDTTAPAPPSDCAAFATSNVITLMWTNPTTDFASVSIRRSMTAYPASLTEGTAVLTASTDTVYSDTTLKEGTYYYSIFAQDNYGNVSTKATASAAITIPKFIGTGATTALEGTVTVTRNTNLSTVQVTVGTNTAVTVSIQERLTSKGAIIGKNTSETGIILVASANAYWINNTSVTVGNSGTGKVIQSDGIVEVAGTLTLGKQTGSTGIYTLSGGILKTEILAIGNGTSQFNWTGGQLQVSTVSTDLINKGNGLLKKPDTTDTLVIQGTYSQSGASTLSLGMSVKNISRTSLASAALQSKQLTAKSSTGVYAMSVQNSFTVNGTLSITLPSDYTPKVGDRFLVIQAGSMTGTFTALSLPDLDTGLAWDTSALYTSGTLRIASESDALTITKPLNYPNPFSIKTGTRIGYRLSKDCDIELRVYTLTGHEICRKSYASGSEGAHSGYNTITFSSVEAGMDLPVDAYIYVLINNGKIIARGKMAVKL